MVQDVLNEDLFYGELGLLPVFFVCLFVFLPYSSGKQRPFLEIPSTS